MRDELLFGPAVDLQHSKRFAIALQDDIHGAPDAVLHEKFGGSKPFLVLKVIGDDGLPGPQCKTGGRSKIGPDARYSDDSGVPTDASADEKAILCRNMLQDFAKLGPHALGRTSRGITQKLIEARALKRRNTKFGQYFLLPNAPAEGA
jgi:hypothetical protein